MVGKDWTDELSGTGKVSIGGNAPRFTPVATVPVTMFIDHQTAVNALVTRVLERLEEGDIDAAGHLLRGLEMMTRACSITSLAVSER